MDSAHSREQLVLQQIFCQTPPSHKSYTEASQRAANENMMIFGKGSWSGLKIQYPLWKPCSKISSHEEVAYNFMDGFQLLEMVPE